MYRSHSLVISVAVLSLLVLGSCFTSINSSIEVADGQSREGDISTVNGSVEVGNGSRVGGLSTVNGAIEGGRDVTIDTDVKTINGSIELVHTSVARDVRTVNGRVRLSENSVVSGDLIVVKKRGNKRRRPLEIELDGGSVIEGDVIVEDPSIEVRVLLSGGSEIKGRVENAEVVKRDI